MKPNVIPHVYIYIVKNATHSIYNYDNAKTTKKTFYLQLDNWQTSYNLERVIQDVTNIVNICWYRNYKQKHNI